MQTHDDKRIASALVKSIPFTATSPMTEPIDGGDSSATDALESMIEAVVSAALYALRSANNQNLQLVKGEQVVELGPQETADFPTWTFWGTTHCTCENIGSTSTTVGIQVGAGHEDVYITPVGTDGFKRDIARQWAGFRLYVTNTSEHPESRVRVTVR
jgi:hypothetical protein